MFAWQIRLNKKNLVEAGRYIYKCLFLPSRGVANPALFSLSVRVYLLITRTKGRV